MSLPLILNEGRAESVGQVARVLRLHLLLDGQSLFHSTLQCPRQRLGQAAQQFAQQYDWRVVVPKFLAIYAELTGTY